MKQLNLSLILFILLTILPSGLLVAQNQPFDCSGIKLDEQTTADQAQMAFDKLRLKGCLGDTLCNTGLLGSNSTVQLVGQSAPMNLCKAVSTWESSKKKDVPEAASIITAIISSLEGIETSGAESVIQARLVEEMKAKRIEIWTTSEIGELPISDWDMDIKMFDRDPNQAIDFLATLRTKCAVATDCPEALKDIAALFSHGQLMERMLSGLLKDYRQAAIKRLNLVDSMWGSVRTSARAVYPWEIVFNNFFIDIDEIDIFAPPPDHQYILLHPGLGYEYSDEFDDGEPLFETAILEVFGYFHWSYDEKGELKRQFGGSLVASWRNHPADENLGLGVMFHLPRNWSVGVTYRENDEYSLLFGVDAAKWFTKEGRWQQKLRGLLN